MRLAKLFTIVSLGLCFFPPCVAATVITAPLSFEPNQGQAGSAIQFVTHGPGYGLYLTPGTVILDLGRQQTSRSSLAQAAVDSIRMTLIGANTAAHPVPADRQSGVVSYFIGNDPKKWRSGLPTYGKVTYPQIYPGVDLVFYGNQRQLEYDLILAPGADPDRIAWQVDGARPSVDAAGNLDLNAPNGPAAFKKPLLYQMYGGQKKIVEGSFAVAGNRISFQVGRYDRSKPLVVDPVLSYASYLGGSGTDHIGLSTGPGLLQVGTSQAIAVDSAGSAYVTGYTYSLDFPTSHPYRSSPPTKISGVRPGQWPSVFVTKFSPDGSSLVYSTYLGGNGSDYAYAIAVDSGGNAYVTGQTNSPDFPVTAGAYQTVCAPIPNNTGISVAAPNCNSSDTSVFVTKLNSTGTALVYSTFLGGYANWAYGTAIAMDAAGRAYIAGNENDICSSSYTFPACFPTTDDAIISGDKTGGRSPQYAFAAVFDPAGAHLLYSTLFGGMDFECNNGCSGTYGTGIAVDGNGYFYLVGETQAARLPTTSGVIQPVGDPLDSTGSNLPASRGFIAKFNPVTSSGGVSLAYATYLGGHTSNLHDYISGIAIDSAGNSYVVGYTNSSDFPVTAGAYGTVCGPNGQTCAAAHVTKLNSSATQILWSTFVGDSKSDASDAVFFTGPIQLDAKGNIYITGQIGGPGFPMVDPVEPTPKGGSQDVLVAELDPTGSSLLFSTHIGSNGLNTVSPAGLALDSAGNIYVAANTNGPDLITTTGAFQTTSADGACCQYGNGVVAKIEATAAPSGPTIALSTAGQVEPFAAEAIVSAYGVNLATGTASASSLPLPTSLDGNTVTVTDSASTARQAPLFYISPAQINFEIPAGTAAGAATVTIQNQNGTSQSAAISVSSVSPGIYQLNASGLVAAWVLPIVSGAQQALQPVYQLSGGNVVPLPLDLGPSNQQIYLEIFGTGVRNATTVTVTVGGLTVPVIYAGPAPGYAGLDQVNIGPLPRALAAQGSVNILLSANGQPANTVNITMK
ncbi:MAG: SBBP repeat-containing protein [Bryobacteraceae bacterium]